MKNLLLTTLIFTIINSYAQNTRQLSPEQRVRDFEYLYEILRENYGFFGMNQRLHNIDWLSKKNEYKERIKLAQNDTAYIFTLKSIIEELNNDHVSLSPTLYYNGYVKAYNRLSQKNSRYSVWINELQKSNRNEYWSSLLASNKSVLKNNLDPIHQKPNYSDSITYNGNIAIMSILSFNMFNIEKERIMIRNFLSRIQECKYLIIDIQDNGGGSVDYWKNNIVGQIIDKPIVNKTYPIIKDGKTNRMFYADFFEKANILKEDSTFSNLSTELITEKFYYQTWIDTISPSNHIGFSGNIYLLVNKKVFSSSEGFAQFCKTTHWATIVGEKTGGDGIGSDPAIIILPESGILINYPSLIGLNHNGALNSEEKTMPDIEITGNSTERLNKLIDYLNTKN